MKTLLKLTFFHAGFIVQDQTLRAKNIIEIIRMTAKN